MLRAFGNFVKNQPVRFFALVCVAITSAFVMWMAWEQHGELRSSQWCDRIFKVVEKLPETQLDAALACVGLQAKQIDAIANGSYINGGTVALCLLALMVIVVAGGHLSFQAPGGFGGSVGSGKQAADRAADQVADAAVDKADQIKAGTAVPPAGDEE